MKSDPRSTRMVGGTLRVEGSPHLTVESVLNMVELPPMTPQSTNLSLVGDGMPMDAYGDFLPTSPCAIATVSAGMIVDVLPGMSTCNSTPLHRPPPMSPLLPADSTSRTRTPNLYAMVDHMEPMEPMELLQEPMLQYNAHLQSTYTACNWSPSAMIKTPGRYDSPRPNRAESMIAGTLTPDDVQRPIKNPAKMYTPGQKQDQSIDKEYFLKPPNTFSSHSNTYPVTAAKPGMTCLDVLVSVAQSEAVRSTEADLDASTPTKTSSKRRRSFTDVYNAAKQTNAFFRLKFVESPLDMDNPMHALTPDGVNKFVQDLEQKRIKYSDALKYTILHKDDNTASVNVDGWNLPVSDEMTIYTLQRQVQVMITLKEAIETFNAIQLSDHEKDLKLDVISDSGFHSKKVFHSAVSALVGAVIRTTTTRRSSDHSKNTYNYLRNSPKNWQEWFERFIKMKFPNSTITGQQIISVSNCYRTHNIALDGLMIANHVAMLDMYDPMNWLSPHTKKKILCVCNEWVFFDKLQHHCTRSDKQICWEFKERANAKAPNDRSKACKAMDTNCMPKVARNSECMVDPELRNEVKQKAMMLAAQISPDCDVKHLQSMAADLYAMTSNLQSNSSCNNMVWMQRDEDS